MSSHTSGPDQLTLPLFANVESVPLSSEMISTDKSLICNPSIQHPKSSKISGQDSTLKEKVGATYWTDFCKEISSHLLLPVGIDSQDLDLNLYNTWSSKTVDKSWFSTKLYTVRNQNFPRIYSQFSTSFFAGCTELENPLKKSKKIYLKLSPAQKQKIKYWFGVARFVYNETIRYLQTPETKANWKEIKTGIIQGLPEWCKDAPYQIKSIAVKDACQAVKNAKRKYIDGGGISKPPLTPPKGG